MSEQFIEPFREQGHFTQFHNSVIDYIMPRVSGNAFKVLCLIIRKTRGFGKKSDEIPYTQIKKLTGIGSPTTISGALKQLLDGGYIIKKSDSDNFAKCRYALNPKFKIAASEIGATTETVATNSTPTDSRNCSDSTPETVAVSTPENGVIKRKTNKQRNSSSSTSAESSQNDGRNAHSKEPFFGTDDSRCNSPHFHALIDACDLDADLLIPRRKMLIAGLAVSLSERYTPEEISAARSRWYKPTAPTPEQLCENMKRLLNTKDVKPNGTNTPATADELEAECRRLESLIAAEQSDALTGSSNNHVPRDAPGLPANVSGSHNGSRGVGGNPAEPQHTRSVHTGFVQACS